jgi:hypothetical protein
MKTAGKTAYTPKPTTQERHQHHRSAEAEAPHSLTLRICRIGASCTPTAAPEPTDCLRCCLVSIIFRLQKRTGRQGRCVAPVHRCSVVHCLLFFCSCSYILHKHPNPITKRISSVTNCDWRGLSHPCRVVKPSYLNYLPTVETKIFRHQN